MGVICIMNAETRHDFLHGIIAGGIRSGHGRFFIFHGIAIVSNGLGKRSTLGARDFGHCRSVGLAEKNILALITARGHMVEAIRQFYSQRSCHAFIIKGQLLDCKT